MQVSSVVWLIFNLFIFLMLALDLGVFHRRSHVVKLKEALIWSAVWIGLALCFNVVVYYWQGTNKALEFLTGYLIEKSLSVDNLFVFIMIFTYFGVDRRYHHKVLFWGILGALVTRAIFIFGGVTLVTKFHWMIYIFGALLIWTGGKMWFHESTEIDPEHNPLLRILRKFMPVTDRYHGDQFVIRKERGGYIATPLLVVLVVVESTDIMFAIDSIPAILAVTHDPFIVYSSNVFAILGLRALYFALAGVMQMFRYLHYGLSAILVFVGIKMLLSSVYKIPTAVALGVVAFFLVASTLFSVWKNRQAARQERVAREADPEQRSEIPSDVDQK